MIFLHNLLRYPRFFFSSMLGLLLIVLNPILKIGTKNKKNKLVLVFLVIFLLFILIALTWVLKEMLFLN
uniref:Uncharacterized protein ycf33 n=1 Tax=Dictyopteris divaricata TaxID=156996 RepID=A0A2I4Q2N7_9PHAE|nr:hypothetical protein [Dictyopteris divaricata]YP_010205383.1 hypothetical protein LK366_pgp008 [Grateloupia livida]AQZ25094.1 hypothetical protein [Dictyopteris divaricata]UAV85952.1 hypothetical protein [Grateloupia livida]